MLRFPSSFSEGSDELFAGYLYFMDAKTPRQIQNELRRIYNMLGDINLHRTDRMTMAHGLEARVPFLDTKFTELIMSVDPSVKIVNREAVATNSEGREKTFLRKLFEQPNANGHSIPHAILWRAKAMQCEGVGEDWVSMLQRKVATEVTDAEMDSAATFYPLNTPQTKEELYYRRIFEEHYAGMAHVVNPWVGGCRAAGAAWESDSYTRAGLANTNVLTHAFQNKSRTAAFSTSASQLGGKRSFSSVASYTDDAIRDAKESGYNMFESYLTQGSDDRSMINPATGTNKYHCKPQPITSNDIFRGSCTCNTPTETGYKAAMKLFNDKLASKQTEAEIEDALRDIFENQRQRIALALGLPEGVEVALCPSGVSTQHL
jgi:Asparagine synthase